MGSSLRPGAADLLQRYRRRSIIVSNNSTHCASDLTSLLARAEVSFRQERVLLAGETTLSRAKALKPRKVLLSANGPMTLLARRLGLPLDESGTADLVVLMRDTDWTYEKLEKSVSALAHGAHLLVSNIDASHPGPDGSPRPETGALLAAIRACVDIEPNRIEIIGKPGFFLFEKACTLLNLSAAECLMVGDNPATDIEGAQRLGMATYLVDPMDDDWCQQVEALMARSSSARTV